MAPVILTIVAASPCTARPAECRWLRITANLIETAGLFTSLRRVGALAKPPGHDERVAHRRAHLGAALAQQRRKAAVA